MVGAKRRALLAGCNYAGKSCELRGCINDVKSVKDLLKERKCRRVKASGENIKDKLGAMAKESVPEDLLVFYFSGHGTKGEFIPDSNQQVEAIVPADFNLITSAYYSLTSYIIIYILMMGSRSMILGKISYARVTIKEGTFVFISDSCHSGGLIDKEKLQIRDLKFEDGSPKNNPEAQESREKKIEPRELIEIFGGLSIFDYVQNNHKGHESVSFNQIRDLMPNVRQDKGILISGCRSEEVSYDISVGLNGDGKAHGAFTSALLSVLQRDAKPLPNKEIVERVRELILEKGYNQHPCLYCMDDNLNALFLFQQHEAPNPEGDTGAEIPLCPPPGGAKSVDLGILDDVKQAAKAYFQKCSPSTQESIKNWYRQLDIDQDNKAKASEVFNILTEKKGCDKVVLGHFISQTMTWDNPLHLDQVLALYYVSKSLVKFCRNCNTFLRSFYFVCLSCFTNEEEEFSLCPKCLEDGKTCEKAGHIRFLDNHALLRLYHVSQVKATKGQMPEKPSHEKINKHLDAAEALFRNDAHLSEPNKEPPKDFELNLSLVTDICSIM
ncbi:hypothetical protein Cgig2_022566 [Carnegiea gigantea]|uniref:Peptidase C14 caspase domain-containing protein n=1 Tax=Carnegiea gigantea TaxID=171969 RepID=A0A9Q1KIL3_9CARY|nr:hypothetical protein Cgig2_022566 [Carnegiea gigantea]